MAENWDAVAKAIDERLKEFGWRQRDLVERSHVSPAIVREIHRNTVNRKRSTRTLQALSTTLGWHPEYLDAVLFGRPLPKVDDTSAQEAGLAERFDTVEQRLDAITARLDELKADIATVIEHVRPTRH